MKTGNTTGRQTRSMILTALFLGMAIVIQLLGRFNPDFSRVFVGPLINALLLLTVIFCGRRYGMLLAVLSPIMAFATGQLNPALAPFIPFIMLGNLALVIPFSFLLRNLTTQVIGIVIGSGLKFFVMMMAAQYAVPVFGLPIPPALQQRLPVAFGLVQLYAALIGGAIALVLGSLLKKRENFKRPIE